MTTMTAERLITSDIVDLALARRSASEGKQWLAKQLGVSRPTLNERFRDNTWTDPEISKLRELGLLRIQGKRLQ